MYSPLILDATQRRVDGARFRRVFLASLEQFGLEADRFFLSTSHAGLRHFDGNAPPSAAADAIASAALVQGGAGGAFPHGFYDGHLSTNPHINPHINPYINGHINPHINGNNINGNITGNMNGNMNGNINLQRRFAHTDSTGELEEISDNEDPTERDDRSKEADRGDSPRRGFKGPSLTVSQIYNPCRARALLFSADDSRSLAVAADERSYLNNYSQTLTRDLNRPVPKLKLIFDLDNTLLHAQSKLRLNNIEPALKDFKDTVSSLPDMYRFILPKQQSQAYFIKMRPGTFQLLDRIYKVCQMAVYTNATREYADIVLAILDPDRSKFAGRVAARDDESGKNDRKDMNRLYNGFNREHLLEELLILDDRRDVWDVAFEKNIVQCNYYEYFESRRDALTTKYANTVGRSIKLPGGACTVPLPLSPSQQAQSAAANQSATSQSSTSQLPQRNIPVLPASEADRGEGGDRISETEIREGVDEKDPADVIDTYVPSDLVNLGADVQDLQDGGAKDFGTIDSGSKESGSKVKSGNTSGSGPNAHTFSGQYSTSSASALKASSNSNPGEGVGVDVGGDMSLETKLGDTDRQLFFLDTLLCDLAQRWYHGVQRREMKSAAVLLQERKSKILAGCVCLMTGYHKIEGPSQYGMLDNGPQHRRRLLHMGAKVVDTASHEVTHVLVMRQTVSTDRARTLCSRTCKFVHNLWIYACEQTWTKVDERFFDSTLLLARYSKPPLRPAFEHWHHTKLYKDSLGDLLNPSPPSPSQNQSRSPSPVYAPSPMNGSSLRDGASRRDQKGYEREGERGEEERAGNGGDGDKNLSESSTDENSTGKSYSRKRKLLRELNPNPNPKSVRRRMEEFREREWSCTGAYSDGAEVWSSAEHIVLRYDPYLSAVLTRKVP